MLMELALEFIPEVLNDMKDTVDNAFLVKDEYILEAMKLLHDHLGIVVEPSELLSRYDSSKQDLFSKQTCSNYYMRREFTPNQIYQWLK